MTKRFVSEPIRPLPGGLDAAALTAGEPSLPPGFTWRGATHRVAEILAKEKVVRMESFSGDRYVRRHRYRLRMDDGAVWDVYFTRQPGTGARGREPRWFLHTVEEESDAAPP